ncbi:MAG: AMP-binding protein [Phycisphaerae bacterium]|nr:AMP-binding protein [Phycisphaerae bacterium]
MKLVHDFLVESAGQFPDKPAIISDGATLSFRAIHQASDCLATALQGAGISRGDRVAVFAENGAAAAVAIFGILKAGGVFVMINPTTKARKLAYMLNDCEVRAVIAHPVLSRALVPALAETLSPPAIIWTQCPTDECVAGLVLSEIIAGPHTTPSDPGLIDIDLCTIIYTSGSTGDPKGVMLTHHNMVNTAWAISTYLGNVPEDVVICMLPLSFGYGLYQIITGGQVGFTVLLEQGFAYPWQILQDMADHRVTGLPGVPTIFATLLQFAPFEGLDLSSLRYISNAAAAFPPAHIRRLQSVLPGVCVFSMYGLTECTRVSYLAPDRLHDKVTSVGKAMPNSEVYIVDEAGRRVGPGTIGELVIRGANVMRGYWGKPRETDERLRDGEIPGEKVLYSGDLFRMDEEGFLYFVGRKDDVFKCKGEKISPREIENVLHEMEAVAVAAVVGVEDPIEGRAIKAFVVPREGAALNESDVLKHCRAHLENYMVPKYVEIRDSLPTTESGKVKKSALASAGAPQSPAT